MTATFSGCLRRIIIGVAFLAFGPPLLAAAPKDAKPNVIIVLTDDQGYGDFSCHGNPVLKTPNLDRLHGESVRLTDFHVTPMCTPTRGQLLTGRDALANGAMCVSCGRTPLRRDLPTMADIFAANGYRTGHFGKWHLGDNHPYRPHERGFQETVYCKSWGISSAGDYWNNDCFDDFYYHNGVLKQFPGYNTDVFFNEAMRWMKTCRDKGEPFFVYLPTTAAHGPHFVPEKYREPYRNLKPQVAGFFGMIANIDENMGRLDAFLQAEELRDNTILIFMTDNGGTAGVPIHNAGMRGRKQELYEGGHRVPCFIRWPADKLRPGDLGELTECQDLLPTLIDLCGLKKPEGAVFDGISLATRLRGEQNQLPDRMLVVQYSRITGELRPKKGDACVMWRRWRLIGGQELYDLDSDPGQKQNIIDKHPDIARKMLDHYERWWAGVEKRVHEFNPISIGSDAENPVRLAPGDWQEVHCDQSAQVRRGEPKNAPWNVLVEKDGEYEIALLRYPPEAKLALTASVPPYQGAVGQLPAGQALPIARARLRIADVDQSQPVRGDETAAVFTVKLKAGRTQLQTWFYDAAGKELCGAYYTVVRRK
ncbi:MAG TPA: arylsulfatase [Gemmataceae bacterium]|nr:arylsulfatase [Gemmataceae bacterium]